MAKSVVSIVKGKDLDDMVEKAVSYLGGIEAFIKPNSTVVMKDLLTIQAEGIHPDITVYNILPTKDGKPIRFLRERDLERHLENHVNEEKKESAPNQEGTGEGEEAEDIQLNRAVDLLKSWNVFQRLKEATPALAMESPSKEP